MASILEGVSLQDAVLLFLLAAGLNVLATGLMVLATYSLRQATAAYRLATLELTKRKAS
jgi:hypothetical protein